MTRRQMFQAIGGIGVAAVAAPVLSASVPGDDGRGPDGKYGHLDIPRCRELGLASYLARVTLDGVDVTPQTQAFDDRAGWVEGLKRFPPSVNGYRAGPDGKLIRERRYGRVHAVVPKLPLVTSPKCDHHKNPPGAPACFDCGARLQGLMV